MKSLAHNAMAVTVVMAALMLAAAPAALADNPAPHPGTRIIKTAFSYQKLIERLAAAVRRNRLGVVTRASATLGAKSLGITIPGNMVIGVFAPRFAVRMLRASVPAGIEAPLRFYIAPYGNAALDEMARELDVIFAGIASDVGKP